MSRFCFSLRHIVAAAAMLLAALVAGSASAQQSGTFQSLIGGPLTGQPAKATVASQMPDASSHVVAKADFTQELARLAAPDIRQAFPRMKLTDIEVLAPATKQYNCIAHSLEVKTWVNPETGSEANPLEKMDNLYAKLGYVRQDGLNFAKEEGLEKVVVYAKLNNDGSIHDVTHAAKQESQGTWTSKLGSLPLIRHSTPEVLRGPVYGTPVAVYVRKAQHA